MEQVCKKTKRALNSSPNKSSTGTYVSHRGSVQYAYHVSPTLSLYSPSEDQDVIKKSTRKRKKKAKEASNIFDFCSDYDDEEILETFETSSATIGSDLHMPAVTVYPNRGRKKKAVVSKSTCTSKKKAMHLENKKMKSKTSTAGNEETKYQHVQKMKQLNESDCEGIRHSIATRQNQKRKATSTTSKRDTVASHDVSTPTEGGDALFDVEKAATSVTTVVASGPAEFVTKSINDRVACVNVNSEVELSNNPLDVAMLRDCSQNITTADETPSSLENFESAGTSTTTKDLPVADKKHPGTANEDCDSMECGTDVVHIKSPLKQHMKPTVSTVVPLLLRSRTWPVAAIAPMQSQVSNAQQTLTVIQNVRRAHECFEHGESLKFRDEVEYLLDNMKPDQSLSVRCLSALNLAQECLNADFLRQLRSHGLINKVLLLLKDVHDQPTLQITMATLCFVVTQGKIDSAVLDRKCIEMLMNLLAIKDDYQLSSPTEEKAITLEGKAAHEFQRIQDKSRNLLDMCPPLLITEEDNESFKSLTLSPASLSLGELASECFLNLTASQSSFNVLKEEMRVLGIIDCVANRAISLTIVCSKFLSSSDQDAKYFMKLIRQLKLLENVLCMNKSNQSYLTVYDGSFLILKLSNYLVLLAESLETEDRIMKGVYVESLLGVLRVLLNISHDNPLASHRVGEHNGIIDAMLKFIFKSPLMLPTNQQFDLLVLSLSLLINLLENNADNRQHIFTTQVNATTVCSGEEMGKNMIASNALIKFFLNHYKKVEVASVEVPTPQRLSRTSPPSSPAVNSPKAKKDLLTTFTSRMKVQRSPPRSQKDTENVSDVHSDIEKEHEEEEEDLEDESVNVSDTLVYSREDFDSALMQAGRHMEDSIISSYSAVLIAILIKNNIEYADTVKLELPGGNYSTLIKVLKEFLSFMNMASFSSTRSGLESVRKIIKFLDGSNC